MRYFFTARRSSIRSSSFVIRHSLVQYSKNVAADVRRRILSHDWPAVSASLPRRLLAARAVTLLLACVCWFLPTRAQASSNETNNTNFGFSGPETYPIDNFIGQLRVADLDGDGLNDLIIVNNSRSKITFLYNQTGKTNRAAKSNLALKRELNELPPDARFRIESIASEKRIAALLVVDLNGDGRPDLAYYGEPKELVVQYNQGTNGWSTPKRFPIEDGQLSPNALCAGDLNGDGRTDLVLLAENCVYLLTQNEDHILN